MDIGTDNFRFQLDDPEKKSKAIRYPMSSELHVSSLDRFNSSAGIPQVLAQLEQDVLFTNANAPNYSSTQCIIQNQRALLYGYFNRIAITEMQIFFRVPTVVTGVNDLFYITNNPGGVGTPVTYPITIPAGNYTGPLLATAMQTAIKATVSNLTTPASFIVAAPLGQSNTSPSNGNAGSGFLFNTGTTDTIILAAPPNGSTLAAQLQVWKCYRLLGATTQSFVGFPSNVPTPSVLTYSPNFLPTDYIDIVSKALTNYKDNKDANSTEASPLGVIARVYLTDAMSTPVPCTAFGYIDNNVLGTGPFSFTKKWAIPNWSQWSPNQAVNDLDITLLDMFGQPLYYSNLKGCAATEWEMTLVASE